MAGENIEQSGNIVTAIEGYQSGAVVVLAVNENAATEPYQVGRRIFEDRVSVEYRLEVGAARAVGARTRRDSRRGCLSDALRHQRQHLRAGDDDGGEGV